MSFGGDTSSTATPALTSLPVQSSVYGLTIPIVRGKTRIASNLIWYGDFTSIAHSSQSGSGGKGGGGSGGGTSYTYTAAAILALGKGAYTIGKVWESKNAYANLTASGLSQSSGAVGQAVWGYLQTSNPSQALAYSGLTYAYAPALDLGSSGSLGNWSFEVASSMTAVASGDVSPALAMQDVLQSEAAFPSSMLGSVTAWDTYCKAQGLLVSMAFDSQKAASDWLKDALDVSHSDCVFSQGQLLFVPLGDAAVTGNGVTYTPNNTPDYDLTEDHFLTSASEDPITVEIKSAEDTYNCIKVEYTDRSDQYNLQIAEAKDAADMDARGLRTKSTVQAHWIHDAATARTYAQLLLQMELGVRRTFKFKLPWLFARICPLDLETITDPYLGFYRVPVRVNTVTELDDGSIEIEAEDCPIGMTTAPAYGSQAGQGFAHDMNEVAGNVSAPVFFEPPVDLTTTGLEVWAAVSGQSSNWGGCTVWSSLDGVSYKKMSTISGGSRYGSLSASLAVGASSVSVALAGLGGTMLTASSNDAANNQSLCFIGTSAGGEFVNYVGAALTGTNAYTLSGLIRGAYRSSNAAHASGQSFVRVDQAIAKSDPLDPSMVGQTLHFKFTSFNIYGGGYQSLADVPEYTYTITGAMLKLPPSNVTGLALSITNNGVLASWDKPMDANWSHTELSFDSGFSVAIDAKKATNHLLGWQTAGAVTIYARHVNEYGEKSATIVSTSIGISLPNQVSMLATDMQTNSLTMRWQDAKTSQPILRYEYYYGAGGATLGACVLYGSKGSDGRDAIINFRTPGLKQVYIIAYDLAGNASTPQSFQVISNMPTDFVLATEWYEDWQTSELVNTSILNGLTGQLLMPVPEKTWAQHFSSNGWSNAADQIAAGYPLYWQPAATSGSHTEQHDCGAVIAGGVITVGVTATTVGNGGTSVVSIRTSVDGSTWSAWTDTSSLIASNFRYVQVRFAVTSDTHGAFLVEDIHVDIRLQILTELTTLTLNAADAAGTFYPTIKPFIDIQQVQITSLASPSIARSDPVIQDSTAPFGVYVKAWDTSNNRVSGTVSLTITGV